MKKPQYIVVHHTAVSYRKNPDQWRATNEYHRTKIWGYKNGKPIKTPISSLGYYGGYNYEISVNGNVKQFRKDGEITVAQYQKDMNDGRAISICLDGNFDVEGLTDKQFQACQKLILDKILEYDIKPENIIPHRSLAGYKSCPGKLIHNNLALFFGIVSKSEKKSVNTIPEKPIGTPEKRANVITRLLQRSRLAQKVINAITNHT